MKLNQSRSSESSFYSAAIYLKVGAVFAITTVSYFLAKTAGVLPSWLLWSDGNLDLALMTSDQTDITPNEINIFNNEDSALTVGDLDRSKFELVEAVSSSAQRHLLEFADNLGVINPIASQAIHVGQEYQYSLKNVFSEKFLLSAKVSQIGLPEWANQRNWLNLKYKTNRFHFLSERVYIKNNKAFLINKTYIDADTYYYNVVIFDLITYKFLSRGFSYCGKTSDIITIIDNDFFVFSPCSNNIRRYRIEDYASYPGFYSVTAETLFAGYPKKVRAINNTVVAIALSEGREALQLVSFNGFDLPMVIGRYTVNSAVDAYDLIVSDNIIFVLTCYFYPTTPQLLMINISNLQNPFLQSSYLNFGCEGSVIDNFYFTTEYISSDIYRLHIVDVKNPVPRLRGQCDLEEFGKVIHVVDKVAFFKTDTGFITINMDDFSKLGRYQIPTGVINDMEIVDKIVFIAIDNSDIQMIDVKDPRAPRLFNTYRAMSNVLNMGVINTTILIAEGISGFSLVDLSQASLVGVPSSLRLNQQFSIEIEGRNTTQLLGREIFNITVTSAGLSELSTLSGQAISLLPGATHSLKFNSNLLFSSNSLLQPNVAQVSGQLAPRWLYLSVEPILIGHYDVYSDVVDVALVEDIAFIIDNCFGLRIIDLSNIKNPRFLSEIATQDCALDLVVVDNKAFIAIGEGGVDVIDISNLNNPQRLCVYNTPGFANAITISENILFIADGYLGIHLVDISHINSFAILGSYDTPDYAKDIILSGDRVFVADRNSGLLIIDFSVLENIHIIGFYDTHGEANRIAATAMHVFIADGFFGLQIVDVSNSQSPNFIGNYDTSGYAENVVVVGNLALVGDGESGLQLIDISDINSPKLLKNYDTSGYAENIVCLGSKILIADGYMGLQFLDLSQWNLNLYPSITDVGNYPIQLSAIDSMGGSASYAFVIRVEGAPQLHASIPAQYAKIGQGFNYFIPQGLFTDPNFDTIDFSAQLFDQQPLPRWVSFSGVAAIFSGTPQEADVGNFTVLISAADHIANSVNATFILYVDHAPVWNQHVDIQAADIDAFYQLTLPANMFIDADNDALSYFAKRASGQVLPAWLNFNAINRTFSGFPSLTDVGSYNLAVIASDPYGGQARAEWTLVVEHFPRSNPAVVLNPPLGDVGKSFIFTVPSNSFIDFDNDILTYSSAYPNGIPLSGWLSFNSQTLTFSGTPTAFDVGDSAFDLVAVDSWGGSASGRRRLNFTVTHFPEAKTVIGNQVIDIGEPYQLVLPVGAFVDLDHEPLSYFAQPLPDWLAFNAVTHIFSGIPNHTLAESYLITAGARDPHGAEAQIQFTLTAEHFPKVNPSVALMPPLAGIGKLFIWGVPSNSFTDLDYDALSYSSVDLDGIPLSGWLSFNAQTLIFSGIPPSLLPGGDIVFDLVATDPLGGKGRCRLNLTVTHFPEAMRALSNQVIDIGKPYQYRVPSDAFIEADQESLVYSAQQHNGEELPEWLHFDNYLQEFSGIPYLAQAENLAIVVIALDPHGAEARNEFSLTVEYFPRPHQPIASVIVGVDRPFTLSISPDVFSDADGDPLNYVARRQEGELWPVWLSFNSRTLTFSGRPSAADVDVLPMELIATDPSGGSAQIHFNITVKYFPEVQNLIPSPLPLRENRFFAWQLPHQTFSEEGELNLQISIARSGSGALPTWLNFDENTLILSGIPAPADVGVLALTVHAADPQGGWMDLLLNFVIEKNVSPQVRKPISDQVANVGEQFSFYVPLDTFVDANGDSLVYWAEQSNGRDLPHWLQFRFVNDSIWFRGKPGRSETGSLNANVITVALYAGDDQQETRALFKISIQGESWLEFFLNKIFPVISALSAAGLYLYIRYKMVTHRNSYLFASHLRKLLNLKYYDFGVHDGETYRMAIEHFINHLDHVHHHFYRNLTPEYRRWFAVAMADLIRQDRQEPRLLQDAGSLTRIYSFMACYGHWPEGVKEFNLVEFESRIPALAVDAVNYWQDWGEYFRGHGRLEPPKNCCDQIIDAIRGFYQWMITPPCAEMLTLMGAGYGHAGNFLQTAVLGCCDSLPSCGRIQLVVQNRCTQFGNSLSFFKHCCKKAGNIEEKDFINKFSS